MWWHLRTGEAILSGGIPRADIFSFTFPTNEWVTHEWLSQLIMWSLYRLAGFSGLIVFFAAITTATWGLVYLISDGKPYVASIFVAVAALASSGVWGSRPQLFNLLLFAVFLFLLEKRKDGSVGGWVFAAFPAIAMVWANLHSGYVLGIVVVGTYAVGDFIEGRRSAPHVRTLAKGDVNRLGVVVVACALAALANPSGFRLWVYPFETLFSSVQREFIGEWMPPARDQPVFWILVGLVVIGILGFVFAQRRPSITDVLVFGGTAVGAFLSVRNIPIFAVASTPIICRYVAMALPSASWNLSDDWGRMRRLFITLLAGGAVGIAAVTIAAATLAGNVETVRSRFPVAAVDWIESENRANERIFNSYNWGGYLIWRRYPVYMDGRADVYGDAGLLSFTQTYYARSGWEESLDRHLVDLVMVERDCGLATALTDSPGWDLAYEDPIARVFERAQ